MNNRSSYLYILNLKGNERFSLVLHEYAKHALVMEGGECNILTLLPLSASSVSVQVGVQLKLTNMDTTTNSPTGHYYHVVWHFL